MEHLFKGCLRFVQVGYQRNQDVECGCIGFGMDGKTLKYRLSVGRRSAELQVSVENVSIGLYVIVFIFLLRCFRHGPCLLRGEDFVLHLLADFQHFFPPLHLQDCFIFGVHSSVDRFFIAFWDCIFNSVEWRFGCS